MRLLRVGDRVLIGSTSVLLRDADSPPPTHTVVIADEDPTAYATRYVSGDKALALPQRRLEMIYELSEQLTTLQDRDALLGDAMKICCETLQFERGAIGVRPVGQRTLDWPVVHNLRGAEGELKISRTLLNRALVHGERAIFTQDGTGATDPTVSMVQQGIRSAMCVPLTHRDQTLGVVYGDRTSTSTTYSDEDIDFLAGIARHISIGLINSHLLDEQREMARLNQEIDLARSIQTGLFPTAFPGRADLRVAALNDPGQRVSGDYYDVIETPDGRIWCLVADVTGEGVAASLLTANLQAAVRLTIAEGGDPGELLARWNRLICGNTEPSKFITCVLTMIDPSTRTVCVASAGHMAPILLRGAHAEPEELSLDSGFPLGVDLSAEFPTQSVPLGSEPCLIFAYSDGVTEAMNQSGEQFEKDRLISTLADLSDRSPKRWSNGYGERCRSSRTAHAKAMTLPCWLYSSPEAARANNSADRHDSRLDATPSKLEPVSLTRKFDVIESQFSKFDRQRLALIGFAVDQEHSLGFPLQWAEQTQQVALVGVRAEPVDLSDLRADLVGLVEEVDLLGAVREAPS